MPRSIPVSFDAQKAEMYNSDPWYILIELQVNDTQSFYLTSSNQPVTSNGDIYDPYPITFDGLINNDEGELFEIDIIISNITRQLMTFIEAAGGLVQKILKLQLVNSANPNDTYSETLEVVTCSVTEKEVRLKCSYFYIADAKFPGALTTRDYCRWEFGSTECGVNIGNILIYNPAVDQTCNKKITGTYSCTFWGDREVAQSLPRNHPQRYGAFPSIPRGLVFDV